MSRCFCTLAIGAPYRRRARQLCDDLPNAEWIVLTDDPLDFSDLPIQAIKHQATGPMAADYIARLPQTGEGRGAAAYHDKRFSLSAALETFDTAIYIDADSRITGPFSTPTFQPGIAVLPVVEKSVAEHLETCGEWRLPFFVELAKHLTGETKILDDARWCHEALVAITKDGNESRFFSAWSTAAEFLQLREVYSGEGGVIGLAAAIAGWNVDYRALTELGSSIQHEGGGPKIR